MTEETARAGTEARPFEEVWPRNDKRDQLLVDLVTPVRGRVRAGDGGRDAGP